MYRRLALSTTLTRSTLCRAINDGSLRYLHWIGNYAKFYRASSLFYDKAIQKNCLWTAHGVKVWPGEVDVGYVRTDDGKVVSAMPLLEDLWDIKWHISIEEKLQLLIAKPWLIATSLCNERGVFRIPLKPTSASARKRICEPLSMG